jgi:arylsulfatase A-like enzyme
VPGTPWTFSPEGGADPKPGFLLAEFCTVETGPTLKALISGHWHYILRVHDSREELFDLESDPNELENLTGKAELQSTLADFRREMKRRFPQLPAAQRLP